MNIGKENVPEFYSIKEGENGYWEKRRKKDFSNVKAHYI